MLAIKTTESVIEVTTKECDEVESFSILKITKDEFWSLISETPIVCKLLDNGNKTFVFGDKTEFTRRWLTLALSHKEKNSNFRESKSYLTTIKGKYCLVRDIASHIISLARRSDNWSYANAMGISDKYATDFARDYKKTEHYGKEATAKLMFEDLAYKKWSKFMDEKYELGLKTYRYQVKNGEINPRTKEIHLKNDKYHVNTK